MLSNNRYGHYHDIKNKTRNYKYVFKKFMTRDLVLIRAYLKLGMRRQDIVIASSYFARDGHVPPPEVSRLVEYCQRRHLPLLLGCDANEHSTVWGSNNTNHRDSKVIKGEHFKPRLKPKTYFIYAQRCL
ncbi:unnamed protein product [Psylliodes chrysocephalus]|uniref:Endonuclease/exonuclease/phosphatase domain-containing protein n=1 Tax=Psylliodes chrysocephalus TaxID=3402493 RepID=A0A9P0GBL3_9CUCU|nr:unnamed protein product [Psylliodes chrysocephala]